MSHKDVTLNAIKKLIDRYKNSTIEPCPLCREVSTPSTVRMYCGIDKPYGCELCPNVVFNPDAAAPCTDRSTRYELSYCHSDREAHKDNLVGFWTRVFALYATTNESELFPPNQRIKDAILAIAEPYRKSQSI